MNIPLVEKLGCAVHIKYLSVLNKANIVIFRSYFWEECNDNATCIELTIASKSLRSIL